MRWASTVSTRTGWKVPAPTCSVTFATSAPRASIASSVAAREAGFDDARVVQDNRVTRIHELRQVGERKIVNGAVCVQVQHAACAALRCGVLGDELGRQRIVELGDEHPYEL